MNELIAAATLLVTAAGLWFAYSYSRQMTVKLSETRLESYSRLWEISGVAAPTRLDGWGDDGHLLLDERRDLWAAMTDWYYAGGGGILLTATTKHLYLNVKHNLICELQDLRPAGLFKLIDEELRASGYKLDDKVRGTLAIRLISLLRTQLTSDLAIYGVTYSGKLNAFEHFFLRGSGVNLRSRAWAEAADLDPRWRWIQRLPAVAARSTEVTPQNPPILGLPQPSPLVGMSARLSMGGIARTPPSSRMAMIKALSRSGDSARSRQRYRDITPKLVAAKSSITSAAGLRGTEFHSGAAMKASPRRSTQNRLFCISRAVPAHQRMSVRIRRSAPCLVVAGPEDRHLWWQ